MADKKELTVEAEELAKDPAVNIVQKPAEPEKLEVTSAEHYGEDLPQEVKDSGIGVGFVSGETSGSAVGIQGEEDHRADTTQKQSQSK